MGLPRRRCLFIVPLTVHKDTDELFSLFFKFSKSFFLSRIDLDKKKAEIASGELFAQIKQYFDSEYLLGAGSPSGSDTDTSDRGIVQGTVSS